MRGVRVGRNVIVVFRPVLFHNTVTKERSNMLYRPVLV